MLKELIDTFEELKKYVYIIDRGTRGKIIIKFTNDKFYHLVGLHKTNNYYVPSRTSDVAGKLNPQRFGGLTYRILQDMGNYHFKIHTSNFGDVYIAGNPNKYACTITNSPVYGTGSY